MKLLQWGNSKLPNMLMFNIPANQEICGRICKGCYSYKAYKIYPNVYPAQQQRYEQTLQPDFTLKICKELKSFRKPFKYVRIHASAGEFYDQAYISKWVSIAKRNPNIIFYAYTKRKKDFNFSTLESLPNVVIINSFQFGGLNYGPLDKAPTGAFICPHQKGAEVQCGVDCTYCMQKDAQTNGVYFVKH